ncbi:hypothetical protein BXZ70DRAFT_1011585 [Cristinia sonorae]|uniref:Uncharacterized protein n=1 Tax=Cristinia sonorae TaxID=1940300 RepID=A0A8K0UIH9_9AGAR|nr:hypothetical protein BXZ70DRAFT_1011585 [Cristinia sonorae]
MGDILPEYSQYHEELHKLINDPPTLSDASLINASEGITAAASGQASESELIDEISKMTGATAGVDKSFLDVAKLFLSVRNALSSPDVQADMRKIEDRWNAHHQSYKNLLWSSRTVAGKAQAAADDFSREFVVFLGDDTESIEGKKREIRHYITELEKDSKAAESMSQGFADLHTGIVSLVEDWRALVKKHDIDAISARLDSLQAEKDTLSRTLEDLKAKVSQLSIAIDMTWGSSGSMKIMFMLAPFWAFRVTYKGFSLSDMMRQLESATKERDDVSVRLSRKQGELLSAVGQLYQVRALHGTLQKSEGDIDSIIARVAGIAKIWAMIRTDIQAISEKLDYVVGTESERLFKTRLNAAAKLYALLGKALYKYQIMVTTDHPAFVGMVLQ